MRSTDYDRFLLFAGSRSGGTTLCKLCDELCIDILNEPHGITSAAQLFSRCQAAKANRMLLGAEEGVQMLSDASKMGIRIVRIQREDTVRQGVSLAIHRKWSRGKPDFVDFCKNLDLSVQEVRAVIEEVRENNRFYDEWLEKEGIEVLTLYHEELYECPEETRTASLKRFLSYIGVSWTEEVREGAIRLCGPERKHTPEWVFQKFSPRQP